MSEGHHEHSHGDFGLTCGCGHCHDEPKNIQGESGFKAFLIGYGFSVAKLLASAAIILLIYLLRVNDTVKLILSIIGGLIAGYPLVINCVKSILRKQFLDENTLMLIATVTAIILGEYAEGVLIVTLYGLGEMLEEIATQNSRKKIAGLASLKSVNARLVSREGITEVSPDTVPIGSFIEVRKGDLVPIDGVLIGGTGEFDTKAVTGESKYLSAENGSKLYSGFVNVGDSVIIKTQKLYKDSTVEQIIATVEGATAKKAESQKFITTFAKIIRP